MIQNWQKHGQIYSKGWAQMPTVHFKDDKTWRIYFSDRTEDGRSFIRYIDVEANNPHKILYEHPISLLSSKVGLFDFYGQMPSCLLQIDNFLYLYYIGWSQRKDVPYHNSIGVVVSDDNGDSFQKLSDGPLLNIDTYDPYFVSTPYVMYNINSELPYSLWYLSCIGWDVVEGHLEPKYHIKFRSSKNGIDWVFPYTSVTLKSSKEGGICRPCVIKEDGICKIWYCYRQINGYRTNKQAAYRIGYAETEKYFNMVAIREDESINLQPSENGFDDTMMCYPYVFKYQDKYHMFYNGNGFGKTGIGYATL